MHHIGYYDCITVDLFEQIDNCRLEKYTMYEKLTKKTNKFYSKKNDD